MTTSLPVEPHGRPYARGAPALELLHVDHGPALLRFERDNRSYFASRVGDRGDEFFSDFDARLRALLAEQDAGTCRFRVLVDGDGEVVGRVDLVDITGGSAELGYRIAERATGAGTAADNRASQAVLARAGFEVAGIAGPDGEVRFVRDLAADRPPMSSARGDGPTIVDHREGAP